MNRRDLFKAAPAGLVLTALPAAADTTPIMDLFREWRAIGNQIDFGESDADDVLEAYSEIRVEIERQMLALPAISAVDVLAKLIAHTQYFDSPVEGKDGEAAIIEARKLVGELA